MMLSSTLHCTTLLLVDSCASRDGTPFKPPETLTPLHGSRLPPDSAHHERSGRASLSYFLVTRNEAQEKRCGGVSKPAIFTLSCVLFSALRMAFPTCQPWRRLSSLSPRTLCSCSAHLTHTSCCDCGPQLFNRAEFAHRLRCALCDPFQVLTPGNVLSVSVRRLQYLVSVLKFCS